MENLNSRHSYLITIVKKTSLLSNYYFFILFQVSLTSYSSQIETQLLKKKTVTLLSIYPALLPTRSGSNWVSDRELLPSNSILVAYHTALSRDYCLERGRVRIQQSHL